MAARDDSVIRGSLIACMIFLVLSIALNCFLWLWGDRLSEEALVASNKLQEVQSQVAKMETSASRLKAMLGRGGFTQAEIDEMKSNVAEDPEMQEIEEQFARDMSYFGQDVEAQERNYTRLPEYLINAIRSRNEQYGMARDEATKIRTDADNDIKNARTQQQMAEQQRDDANKKLNSVTAQFDEDRTRMNKEKEDTKDKLNKTVLDFNSLRKRASEENNKLVAKTRQLQGTIDTQKLRLNELLSDNFETMQGEIRYVVRGGNVVTINLGSADALRPGVTFGVIDGDEIRLKDAKVKASIQVTQIQGPHLAAARVVARPEIRNPIIPGDKIFSPFWAPGRQVKIALAGDIDIDGDERPDNEAIKGQILAAGAVVSAEISPSGVGIDDLDPGVRFLVIGADPEIREDDEEAAQTVAAMGRVKAKAGELGLTIIPVWKLQSYLKTIDETLTTPLGSAVRGADFPPVSTGPRSSLPNNLPELYQRQTEGMQIDDKVLQP